MKTQWIPPYSNEPIEEHELKGSFYFDKVTRKTVNEYLGGNFEFVQVLHEGKPMYMLVNEFGALEPQLLVNTRATDIYHTAVVKPRCEEEGTPYVACHYAQIHGPAILVMEEMT